MKKVILGIVVLMLAAVGAYMLVIPDGKAPEVSSPSTKSKAEPSVTTGTEAPGGSLRPHRPEAEKAQPASTVQPPPGTMRPLNPAEIALEARLKRPFNQYVYHVGAWWGQASKLLSVSDPEFTAEIRARGREMRELSDLNDDQLKVEEALAKEAIMVQRLKAVANTPDLKNIASYIEACLQATQAGQDPSTVVRPVMNTP